MVLGGMVHVVDGVSPYYWFTQDRDKYKINN